MTVSVTPFGGGWSRRRGRRCLNPVAVTGTIIEFYTQLEINKGGKLDDRLKDTGTNRAFASGTCARTPRSHTNRDRPKHAQRPVDHEPAHHPWRVAPQPTYPRPPDPPTTRLPTTYAWPTSSAQPGYRTSFERLSRNFWFCCARSVGPVTPTQIPLRQHRRAARECRAACRAQPAAIGVFVQYRTGRLCQVCNLFVDQVHRKQSLSPGHYHLKLHHWKSFRVRSSKTSLMLNSIPCKDFRS